MWTDPESSAGELQAKAKILVVRDIERDDIEFISKTLGCLPIADVESMRPEKLGHAALVAESPVRPDTMLNMAPMWPGLPRGRL